MHRPQCRGGEEEGPTEGARAGSEEAHSPYAPVCTRKRACVVASIAWQVIACTVNTQYRIMCFPVTILQTSSTLILMMTIYEMSL